MSNLDTMKRQMPWSDEEEDSSSDESSTPDSDNEDKEKDNDKASGVESGKKKKSKGIDFEALSRHGYKGGLSVLSVRPPKDADDKKQDWSWATGKERREANTEETYEDRQKTRAAIVEGEQLSNARTQREKNLSFSQKEKRKRDIGQASRGKSYVEEEKRLLRESGIYSGFDS